MFYDWKNNNIEYYNKIYKKIENDLIDSKDESILNEK
jgi:hypothetical protein